MSSLVIPARSPREMRPFRALLLGALLCLLGMGSAARAQDADPLVVRASQRPLRVQQGRSSTVSVQLVIAKGWHVFAQPALVDGVKSLQATLASGNGLVATPGKLPPFKKIAMPALGKDANVYEGPIRLVFSVKADGKAPLGLQSLQGVVQYQACSDSACRLPKKTKFAVPVMVVK